MKKSFQPSDLMRNTMTKHVPQDHRKREPHEKLNTACTHYIHLKDALVTSNAGEAKKEADELQKFLASLSKGQKSAEEAKKFRQVRTLNQGAFWLANEK